MFSSAFFEQESIQNSGQCAAVWSQIHVSHRISDLLTGSTGMSELWGTFVLVTTLWLVTKLLRALSSSIRLSLIDKHNQGRINPNATNVKQYIPRISTAHRHNGALCRAGSLSSEGTSEKSVLFCWRTNKLQIRTFSCYVGIY